MDAHTLDKLDFDRVRRMLAAEACCSLGRELALRIKPSRRANQVERWIEQGRQFQRYVEAHGLPPLGGLHDVRPLVRKAVPPAKLEPAEFADLASTVLAVNHVRRYLADLSADDSLLAPLAARLGDFSVLAHRIGLAIDDRGRVRDDASERLSRMRREIDEVKHQTREVFDRLLRQPQVSRFLQYPNATFHADRMVLPLRAEQRGRIPGIIHRTSDSGQTLFVEPAEAVELNNRRVDLLLQEQEEINRILWELTHLVHVNQTEILRTLESVAVIDLLTAKVKLARRRSMIFPPLNDQHRVHLQQARNPILLALADDGTSTGDDTPGPFTSPVRPPAGNAPDMPGGSHPHRVVPIDVRLGDDFDIMIITGPNTGGKTAALKTVGLCVCMAQAGLPIPVDEGSTLPAFDGVWIDVGDEQSLVQSLSTFSAHLARILAILSRARRSTLILLDELGAGTDPDEGAAIGRAIVEHLLASGCLAMITTHLGALKAMGYEHDRIDNASVQFDLETLRPTYELRIGEPGNSNAIAIASRLGMPRRLVQTARRHLATRHRALQRAIAGTLRARRDAEQSRRDLELARAEAARATLAALDEAKALRRQREAYEAWLLRIMSLQTGDEVRVRNFDRPGRLVRVRLDKQQASVDLGAMQVDVPLTELVFDAGAI